MLAVRPGFDFMSTGALHLKPTHPVAAATRGFVLLLHKALRRSFPGDIKPVLFLR